MRNILYRNAAFLAFLAIVLLSQGGCSYEGSLKDWVKEKLFGPSPRQMVAMAFDPNDADRRREGITLLSERSWGLRDPHLKGFALMLAADPDPSVRSAAARALGKAGDANYLPDLAVALGRRGQADAVRCDCAVALDNVIGEPAIDVLTRHATEDRFVDVRVNCVRALRHYRKQKVVRTLVMCLSDQAFEVRHEAREALVAIMGADHGYEPEDWAAVTGVELPPAPTQTYKPWWDWFGVKSPRRKTVRKDAPAAPAPPEDTPKPKAEPKRPWWDWFGVNKPDRPADPKPKAKPKRPWWDWFRVK